MKTTNLNSKDSKKSFNIQYFANVRDRKPDSSSDDDRKTKSERSRNSKNSKNYDYKKGNNKQTSNKTQERKMNYSRDGITISGVNASLNTVGTPNDEYKALNSFVRFPISVLFDPSQNVYVEKSFNDVLQKLSVNAGYATTTTFGDIKSVLHNSAKVYAHLLMMFRAANCNSLRDQNGHAVNGLLNVYNKHALYRDSRDYYSYLASGTAMPHSTWNLFQPISNAVWEQTYLSVLDRVYLPNGVKAILDYFLGGVFRNQYSMLGNNAFITFITEEIFNNTSSSDMADMFATLVADLDTARTATPDLVALMQQMGFDTLHAIQSDFQRDRSGQTLTIVEDPEVPKALFRGISTIFGDLVSNDGAIKGLYVDTSDTVSSMFNYSYHLQLSADDLLYDLLLNSRFQKEFMGRNVEVDTATLFPLPNIMTQDGTVSYHIATFNVSHVTTTTPFSDPTIYERFGRAKSHYDFLIGIPLFAKLVATYDEQAATFQSTFANLITDASHVYNFDEVSLSVALETLSVKTVFGLEWRENLQALLLSLGRVNDLRIGQRSNK